ncbi:MAG: molybdopterin molybdenumtransferase MoeA [Bryobacterales bacterium]|nr:molybdopterin molybdenumtransferase MoeA [Bryobacterales bacterium]
MPPLTFNEARACVVEKVGALLRVEALEIEHVDIEHAAGRVLARSLRADRDYPALARSVRDGFAVRVCDLPGEFRVIGEVRAGEISAQRVGPGEAIEIMTGAPVPVGADVVVMVEHVTRDGGRIRTDRTAVPGEFINPRASEARSGEAVLPAGVRLDYSSIALAATFGVANVPVFPRPRVAILATGDEIVPVRETPREFQIRNSNAYSLAVQVARAGGMPEILPVAKDTSEDTMRLIERGLDSDLLLLSGGVSAGKYDLVETVLADLGAEFFFDRVKIQPGQPLVFGRARGKFFFGLPGNPASTMVTFEIFARAAVEILSGIERPVLPFLLAPLTADFRHKTGLTRFLPAMLSGDGSGVTPIAWQGSGDVPSIARSNVYLVAAADRAEWKAGDLIQVLMK